MEIKASVVQSNFQKSNIGVQSASNSYPIKNAVSVQMPQYLVQNPYTHIRNDTHSLGLSKNINFVKHQPQTKPIVKINTN